MPYKTMKHGEERHLIVDWEAYADEMSVTPNLGDDEFKIELLMTRGCPIRTSCIRIEEGVNSICNHLGSFVLAESGRVGFTELTCTYGNESRLRKVRELWVEGCQLGRNCAKCEDILSINIPASPKPEKSHTYVTCLNRHRGGG